MGMGRFLATSLRCCTNKSQLKRCRTISQNRSSPKRSSKAARLLRIQSYVMCIILCGGDTVSEFPGMPAHKVIDTYLEYADFIGCLVERDSMDSSVLTLDFDAYLRWWVIMGTLRKTPFSILGKMGFKVNSPMADRVRVVSAPGYLDNLRDALAADSRIDAVGGNAKYNVPLEADMRCEKVRIDARWSQWSNVMAPDPNFSQRTAGLKPIDPARPLGQWNAQPKYTDHAAEAQRAANTLAAAAAAARVLVPLAQLQTSYGADLSTMPVAEVRDQLLVRGVHEAELVGPSGSSKQVKTLRRDLVDRGDDVVVAMDDSDMDHADTNTTDAATAAASQRGDDRPPFWVQCAVCECYRRTRSMLTVADEWVCSDNTEPEYARCDAPQERAQPGEDAPWEDDEVDFQPAEESDEDEGDSDQGKESEDQRDDGDNDGEDGREDGDDGDDYEEGGGDEEGGDDGEAVEDEGCVICMRENARMVHWVGCSSCNAWAHAKCAGRVTPAQRARDWCCSGCSTE